MPEIALLESEGSSGNNAGMERSELSVLCVDDVFEADVFGEVCSRNNGDCGAEDRLEMTIGVEIRRRKTRSTRWLVRIVCQVIGEGKIGVYTMS